MNPISHDRSRVRRVSTVAIASLLGLTVMAGCGSSGSDSSSSGTDKSANTASSGTDKTANTAATGGITVPTATGTPVSIIADDKSATEQFFTLDTASVGAGPTTFTFKNDGDREHEMIILKTDTPYDQLKVGSDNKVSEADSVGEISETPAGKTVVKTFDLAAGNYVLVCNIEKHYQQGMRAAFTVKP
jgi:uncharacterized cupredoxin-like copper-binding protein